MRTKPATLREQLDFQINLKNQAIDGLRNATDEIIKLRARIEELEYAALNLLRHGPCSDPDCCQTAREESAARRLLDDVLNRK